MKCMNCGKPNLYIQEYNQQFGKGSRAVMVENLPVIHCPDCGKQYLTPDILHVLDRVLIAGRSHPHSGSLKFGDYLVEQLAEAA